MIILVDEEIGIVNADKDEKIFLAYYKHAKEQLGELKCAWGEKKVSDNDIIIFESLDRAEENIRFIHDSGYGNKGNYAEVRHICTVSVFHMDGGHQPVKSDIPASKQLQEIEENYNKHRFRFPSKKPNVLTITERDGTTYDQLIAVISTLEDMGDDEEYEDEEE